MSLGCNRCEPRGHLPPPQRVCPDFEFPDEPQPTPVECPTDEMVRARLWRFLEWIAIIALGATLTIKLLNDSLDPPPGLEGQTWFWLSLVVLVAWGAVGLALAVRTVSVTPNVTLMLGSHPFLLLALGAWMVGVLVGGIPRVVAAAVATAASLLEAYRSYSLGPEKPSVATYVLFLGFKAYLAGLSAFVLALIVAERASLGWGIAALGTSAWASIDLMTFILPFPVLVGVVAWELQRNTERELLLVAAGFALLVLRGVWYRLFSNETRHGRNLFVRRLTGAQ